MRKRAGISFLFLILGAAIGGLFGIRLSFHLAQARSLPQPPPSPTPEMLPNGWYRYTDKAAGYAISYPPTVRFTISRDKPLEFPTVGLILPPSTGRGNQWMTIMVLRNPKRLPPIQFIANDLQEVFRGHNELKVRPAKIYLGMQEAFRVDIAPFMPAVYIFHQDKVYFLALHMDMLLGMPPTPGARKMFFEIASTFTLLDEEGR